MSRPAARPRLPASDDPSVTSPIDLDERWLALFGSAPPHRAAFMEAGIAWKEQANAHGDLPNHILRDLRIVAHQVSEARRHPTNTSQLPVAMPVQNRGTNPAPRTKSIKSTSSATQHSPRSAAAASAAAPTTLLPASSQLAIGAQLVKHHAGETHVVEVIADGFVYRDQTYASLSAIAKVITGTHWNGLLFFGLRRRKTYARKPHA